MVVVRGLLSSTAGTELGAQAQQPVLQDPVLFDKIPEPEDDENDMLDLAYGLTET